MTYETKLIYRSEETHSMVISKATAIYLDDAVSQMMDDMRDFFYNKDPDTYLKDLTVSCMRESVITYTPVEYWLEKFGWSY
jgi:hypothetical protein